MPLDRSGKEAIQVWSRHTVEVVNDMFFYLKLVKLISFSSHEYLKLYFVCVFVFAALLARSSSCRTSSFFKAVTSRDSSRKTNQDESLVS